MSFKNKLAALAIASMAATSVWAAPQTYVIDNTHTFPSFSYNHMGLSTQLSKFKDTAGTVVFDKEAQTGSVDIVIDTTSVETGFPTFNEHIQGADFLDTAQFPQATFKSTGVLFENGQPARINGDLTIKGVSKPVTLTVTSFTNKEHPMLKKNAIGANAYTTIKRSEFNAGKFAPAVGDEVRIDIAIEAIEQ